MLITLLLTACRSGSPPDIRTPGQSAAALIRVADDTRANGDLPTAISLYRRAHDIRPADPQPLERLGSALTQLKSYTEAARAYRSALDLAPHDPELHRGLATVLLSLNQPEAAVRELKAALNESPEDPRLFNAMGVAHDLMGHHDLAQEDYLDGLRVAPQHGGLRNNYALSQALSGNFNAAIETLNKLTDDPSAPPRYRLNLALIYGLAGDDRKAGATARTVLDQTSVRSNLAYYATLRAMDDRARTAAIIGGQVHGLPVAEVPPAKSDPITTEPVSPSESEPPAAQDQQAENAQTPPSGEAPAVGPPTQLTPADPNAADQATTPPASPDPAPQSTDTAAATPPTKPASAPAEPPVTPPVATAHARPTPAVPSAYVVQLGTFVSEANARKLADQLKGKGYRISVERFQDPEGKKWFAVRAGRYPDAAKAAVKAREMHDAEQLPAVVVPIFAQAPAPVATAQHG